MGCHLGRAMPIPIISEAYGQVEFELSCLARGDNLDELLQSLSLLSPSAC